MASKFNLIMRGSAFRVLQTLVSIVIGLLMMPFLIGTLGEELYGLWVVIASIVGTYYLFDMGFNQAITRYVVKYIHQDNPAGANKIINTALVIYSVLGLVLLLVSITASIFGAEQLMENTENMSLAKTILIISGLSIALEFPAKSFPGIISAYMRYDVVASVRFSKVILDALLIYLAVSNGYGLVSMALITFITGLISTAIYIKFSTSLFKELKYDIRLVDKKTFKDVFHFSKWVFVFDISSMIRDKMDIWFISYFIGLSALPAYYVAVRLVEYALTFMQQATNLSGPIFTEYYTKRETIKLEKSFTLFSKTNAFLFTLGFAGFYVVGNTFIELWMKDAVDTRLAYDCLIILTAGRFLTYLTTPIQSMMMTMNTHRQGAIIAACETPVAAGLCYFLVPNYGVTGAAISVALPYFIGRIIILPIFMGSLIRAAIKKMLARVCVFMLAVCCAIYFTDIYFLSHLETNFFLLFLSGTVTVLITLLFSVLLWTKSEAVMAMNVLRHKKV